MSGLATVRSAQDDVAGMQAALSAVQSGLDVVEAAGEAVEDVRCGLHRMLKFGIALVVVGAIIAVWMKWIRDDDEDQSA